MRRSRASITMRDSLADVKVRRDSLVMPVFVDENLREKKEIQEMRGIYRYDINSYRKHLDHLTANGIRNILLFGIPSHKDSTGSASYSSEGIVQKAIAIARENYSLNVMADLCLCEYTDTGQCGLIRNGAVDNDSTLKVYEKIALSYAQAGVNVIAPSGMMDGQVGVIRNALDTSGFNNTMIMAYSVKYASTLYNPFRYAADSAPREGDRKSYQMDYRRSQEWIDEIELDINEGADIIMVKPGLFYLDIVRSVRERFHKPLAVYSVSGEYVMIRNAIDSGFLPQETLEEYLYSFFRAGADLLITYFADYLTSGNVSLAAFR
ncbi:MAG: porphobilinogen synthase [Candidatus Thermoplasmatota archaeon]|nr:porphobilinogen synthase [Candidatus Thermoplasmatota archaeon]